MDHCIRSLCLDHKYCSVTSPITTLSCHSMISHPEPLCGCSATAHPCGTHHSIHGRCSWAGHYPYYTSVTCKKVELSPTFPCPTPIIRRETVLARRDPDQFYYMGVVRQEEKPGLFLIEFTKPSSEGERYTATLQQTSVADIIQYDEALRQAITPGDNVLAPWEAEQARYGPGTVISGLETRDPLRATEDEELTVSFWNGKKAKVPLIVAVWISPSLHRRIVDRLHHPISSHQYHQESEQSTTTYVITDRCTQIPVPMCLANHVHKHRWNHCTAYPQPTHQHCSCCCFPNHSSCTCCYDPKCQDWWPLSPRTSVYIQGKKDPDDDSRLHSIMKGRESPGREGHRFSSSSETEEEESLEDEESENETCLSKTTQSTMVDSSVNTDSSLWDKPRLDISERPDWKYWKHSQPEPFYKKPGIMKSKNKASTLDSRATLSDIVGLSNQSALFETISTSPARRLSMKDVLTHTDFYPSEKQQASLVAEGFRDSEFEKLRNKTTLEKRQNKIKHNKWEQKREEDAGQKYSDSQEAHRKKTLHRLQNEEMKLREQEMRNIDVMKAKLAVQEERSEHHQTMAAEDKKREQRRMDHLRKVREKIDQKEYQKCAANEQREMNHMAAQRRRVQNHYKEVAEKVFQAELQEMQRSNPRVSYMEA
ncbi:uncharacterized protein C11orf16 homolog isoform X2 [Pseudophryne corroboree]|uniref:uncharacterized protein C11orf16 homolog isoform X2 n=1 Tax=Pseudophryne corroboree TaxID=495146 RepID=UPI003081BBA9